MKSAATITVKVAANARAVTCMAAIAATTAMAVPATRMQRRRPSKARPLWLLRPLCKLRPQHLQWQQ